MFDPDLANLAWQKPVCQNIFFFLFSFELIAIICIQEIFYFSMNMFTASFIVPSTEHDYSPTAYTSTLGWMQSGLKYIFEINIKLSAWIP